MWKFLGAIHHLIRINFLNNILKTILSIFKSSTLGERVIYFDVPAASSIL